MAWLSGGWGKRIEITVSNTNIGSDLTHFPLLLTLGTSVGTGADDVSAIFDELTSDANRLKIAVTKADGTTEIKCEIELWDDANETAFLWVASSALTLSSSGTTTLFIYYDAGHADNTANVGDVASAAGEAVWDSDYVVVAHLSETTGTHLDSTSNDNDESAKSITDQDVAGQIGGGDNFLEDHIQFPIAGMVTAEGTIQVWFEEDTQLRNDFIFSHRPGGDTRIYARTNSGTLVNRYVAASQTGPSIPAGWNHVAVSYNGGDWFINFNDATQVVPAATAAIATIDTHVVIGSYVDLGTGQNLDGNMDELRVSKIQRSDDWLQADWHSATDNLVSYGAEELEPTTDFPLDCLPGAFVITGAAIAQEVDFIAAPGAVVLTGVEIAQEVDFNALPTTFAIGGVSAAIEPITIASVDDDDIDDAETGVGVVCTEAEAVQGTGKFEISDNATYGAGTVVAQTITGWTDTLVTITVVIGALEPGVTRYGWLTNDSGVRNATGFVLRLRRAQAVVMPLSGNIAASGEDTTHQMTPPAGKSAGDYTAGRMQDDENPADPVDLATDEFTELEYAVKFLPAARDVEYSLRLSIAGVPIDLYDQVATIDVPEAVSDFPLDCDPGSFAITGEAEVNEIDFPAAPDSFAITGTAASIVADYFDDAFPGSFNITGTDAAPVADYFDDALPATFTINGIAISLDIGYNADPGTIVITGVLADLISDYVQTLVPGAYSIGGVAAPFSYDLIAEPVAFGINGVAIALDIGYNADPESFAINGTATDLDVDYDLEADPTPFVINGTVADLITDYALEADPGSFAITGAEEVNEIALDSDPTAFVIAGEPVDFDLALEANPASFAINGDTAELVSAGDLNSDPGTIAITGVAAIFDYDLNAEPASFGINGVEISIELGLDADPGTHTITGTAAAIVADLVETVDPGAFNIGGVAAVGDLDLPVDSGSIAITGAAADLKIDYVLEADPASFAINGTVIDLDVDYDLEADPATFAINGAVTELILSINLEADPEAYVITGAAVEFLVDYVLDADPGALAIGGVAVAVPVDHVLNADLAAYVINGIAADLSISTDIDADPGAIVITGSIEVNEIEHPADPSAFAITGVPAALTREFSLDCDPASFAVNGSAIAFDFTLIAVPGVITVTGFDATIVADYDLEADPTSYILTGIAADVVIDYTVLADPATYTITGIAAELVIQFGIIASPATYVITGVAADTVFEVEGINLDSASLTIAGFPATFFHVRLTDNVVDILIRPRIDDVVGRLRNISIEVRQHVTDVEGRTRVVDEIDRSSIEDT